MVDSRAKGARAESKVAQVLSQHTGLKWRRTPGSGALNEEHMLKGDVYVPGEHNLYCVEIKNYKDDKISSKMLTDKISQIEIWWQQTLRQAKQVQKRPLLIFKFDRSKLFCAVEEIDLNKQNSRYLYYSPLGVFILKLEDWLIENKPIFIK